MKRFEEVIIIGAGGHAKVIADIIIESGDEVLGFLDDAPSNNKFFFRRILGKVEDAVKFRDDAKFIIGIGNNETRKQIAEKYDLEWYTAIHPTAVIGLDVNIGVGSAVMAKAVINTGTMIGRHCIINTASVVEHDNNIAGYVHISPGVMVGGTVDIGERTHIGIGAAIKNNLSITSGCLIGAGAVVVKDIQEQGTYVGVPAVKK